MPKSYSPKLIQLPGTRLSPETVLHRTLNKIKRIKGIAIVIQWDDDTMEADWSQMKVSELCMASMLLDDLTRNELMYSKELDPLPENGPSKGA